MRCLYCGKPLPLLKKLTGGGEFCSDAHRHKYQEEYNKLALSRLLQAQAPAGEGGSGGSAAPRGARQLPAPGPRPGQRALPPPSPSPSSTLNNSRALPAPSTTQQIPVQALPLRDVPPAAKPPVMAKPASPPPWQPPARAAQPPVQAPAPAPPPLPPQPDPPFADFRIPRYQPDSKIKLAKPRWADSAPDLGLASKVNRPVRADLEILPFDWEAMAESIEQANRPQADPPEAPAWDHPIEFRPPVAAEIRWKEDGLSITGPIIYPVASPVLLAPRSPMQVRQKVSVPPKKAPLFQREIPTAFGSPKWDLPFHAAAWRPSLNPVTAPALAVSKKIETKAPVPQAVPVEAVEQIEVHEEISLQELETVATEAQTVESPVLNEAVSEPEVQPVLAPAEQHEIEVDASDAHDSVEVFIDLSVLGLMEDKPALRR